MKFKKRGENSYMWYVYILQCKDNSFYSGISKNVTGRLEAHNKGEGGKYTRVKRPVELLYTEQVVSKSQALSREIEIKKLSRANKLKLIKYGPGSRFPSALSI